MLICLDKTDAINETYWLIQWKLPENRKFKRCEKLDVLNEVASL